MSFFKSLFKAVVVGTLVFMTGGAAAAYFAGNAIVWSSLALQGAALSGISSVVGYLSRPKTDRQAANDRLNISVNASAEGKFVFGETASGTDVVYNEKIGDDKVFYVVAAAWHEIESFGSLHFNDELITLDGTGTSTGDWAGVVKVIYKTGTLTQDAIQVAGSTWPSAAKGAGVAHFGMFFDVGAEKGQEKLSGGIPSRITQTIKGAKVYDPRLDSSIGGTGSHRVNDQSTWQFENGGKQLGGNWALVVAHYLLGYRQNGKLIYGVGVDAADIDWQQVADMADVCDTLVDSKPKYKVGGIIPITNDHEAVIKQFEDAIDGKVAKSGGKYYIYAPHDDTADVKMVITDDDIIAESGVNYSPTAGLQSLFNTATGQYISPENLYQFAPYPEVVETTALEDDGKARIVAYDFSMIQDATLAQRISRERIRRSRFTASMSLALGPKYIALKPFDVVQINIKETDNQPELFRIIRIVGSVNGYAEVEFIEEDASIYDVSAPLGTPLTQLDPASYNPAQVITPVNVQATNVIVQGDTSAKDAIRVTWNNPGAFVEDSEIRYRVTGSDDDYAYARTTSLNSAIISPVEPLTEYDIQVRHITRELVLSDYVEITHTSGDETVNVIRQSQIDDLVPNAPVIKDISAELSALDSVLGGVDALIEEVSQDIAIEYERLENTKEIRQVRIDNLAKAEALVNEYLEELGGETLPELNARLTVAEAEIDTLENVTLPALDSRLDAAETELSVVVDTTIPQVQSELDIAQGQIATIQGEVFAATASVPQTIDDVLEEISQDTAEIFQEIYASRIGANSITALAIKANAVTADKIVANAITADKIAANAITADKIQANAIDGRTITGLTINGAVINAGTLNAIDIVGTSTISGASIIGNSISGGTISGAAMTAGSITSAAISAGSIVGTSIEGAFIGGTEIIGGDISGTNITGTTITGGFIFGTEIEGVTITGSTSIFSPTISGGTIQGTNITATNTITGATINGAAINTGTLTGNTINGGTINSLTANSVTLNTSTMNAGTINSVTINTSTLTGNTVNGGTVTGSLVRTAASGSRVEVQDDGTYLVWGGDGAKNDGNAAFFVKKNGSAKFAGDISGSSGTFNGTVKAENIIGETVGGAIVDINRTFAPITNGAEERILNMSIAPSAIVRDIIIPPLLVQSRSPLGDTVGLIKIKVNGVLAKQQSIPIPRTRDEFGDTLPDNYVTSRQFGVELPASASSASVEVYIQVNVNLVSIGINGSDSVVFAVSRSEEITILSP